MTIWVALHVPDLALQATTLGRLINVPLAVTVGEGPHSRILITNPRAAQEGVQAGMLASAAKLRCDALVLLPRNPTQEHTCLTQLALTALTFTPSVALHVEAVLLEIAPSLRLFGGLHALATRLKTSVASTGLTVQVGLASTPLAAWLIARARSRGLPVRQARHRDALAGILAPLPLDLFDWPVNLLQTLSALGVCTIADLHRLPRAGIRRRFGDRILNDLDCAHGHRPDPRPYFVAPQEYEAKFELFDGSHDLEQLLRVADRLWVGLAGFLRSCALAAVTHGITFDHGRRAGQTHLDVATRRPTTDVARWRLIAREYLQRTPLPAAVYAVHLHRVQTRPYHPHPGQLFPGDAFDDMLQLDDLMEHLAVRLGSDRVMRIRAVSDHRPERATRPAAHVPAKETKENKAAAALPAPSSSAPQPYGLLAQPRSLVERHGAPTWHGEVTFLAGPERIETGWWDGAPARRDYFVVRNRHGECGWVYRDLSRGGWYLHGLFV